VIVDAEGAVVGSTGLEVETPHRAATGYVLARSAWGRGYATEVATAMVGLAAELRIGRLYALCHTENRPSARVLVKAGFDYEGVLRRHTVFPNLDPEAAQDVECWARLGPP
jgi:RimJ/RimL family protein N-acetyltransferase